MSPNPELSIVIATYGRAETLARVLRYLAQQDLDPKRFEVIVVDDATPDDSIELTRALIAEMPYDLRVLRNSENHGPGYTQNRGIEAARGDVLMIMTDDVFVTPQVVRTHLEFHRENPEPEVAALGKVVQSPETRQSALMRKWDPFRFWTVEGCQRLPFYMFWACHISCKRQFMLQHGMFREHRGRAGYVAFEDLEVGFRLSQQGMKLFYLPNAVSYHYHPHTLPQAIERWYMRGLNFGEFRQYVPAPELVVYFHVLNARTFGEYIKVLRGPNEFRGWERSLSWHFFRHGVRSLILNGVTEPLIWKPLLQCAEKYPMVEKLLSRHTYRSFFYYHFLRGVNDGFRKYGN